MRLRRRVFMCQRPFSYVRSSCVSSSHPASPLPQSRQHQALDRGIPSAVMSATSSTVVCLICNPHLLLFLVFSRYQNVLLWLLLRQPGWPQVWGQLPRLPLPGRTCCSSLFLTSTSTYCCGCSCSNLAASLADMTGTCNTQTHTFFTRQQLRLLQLGLETCR